MTDNRYDQLTREHLDGLSALIAYHLRSYKREWASPSEGVDESEQELSRQKAIIQTLRRQRQEFEDLVVGIGGPLT